MKIRITTLAVIATTLFFSSINSVHAGGCGGRGGISIGFGGGGISIGHGGGHGGGIAGTIGGIIAHQHNNHQHNSHPQYETHQHVPQHAPQHVPYTQNYPQPSYPQVSPPVVYSQPSNSQPVYSQPITSQNAPIQQNTNAAQIGVGQISGMQNNPIQSNQPQQMTSGMQPSQNTAMQGSQNGMNAPTQQIPVNTSAPSQSAQAAQSELSALQLLASMNGDMAESSNAALEVASSIESPASMGGNQPNGAHVGAWRVELPGNQNITLVLNADNNFQWNAIKDGKSSSFQGQYIMDAGRLTLVRSTDLQQMAGSWTSEGANFIFKLDGATSSGLAFSRAQ